MIYLIVLTDVNTHKTKTICMMMMMIIPIEESDKKPSTCNLNMFQSNYEILIQSNL